MANSTASLSSPVERRRHPRYSLHSARWNLLGPETGTQPDKPEWRVLNISSGGACLVSPRELTVGDRLPTLIDLHSLNLGTVQVTVQIVWSHRVDQDRYVSGAVFIDSNSGWLDAADDQIQETPDAV